MCEFFIFSFQNHHYLNMKHHLTDSISGHEASVKHVVFGSSCRFRSFLRGCLLQYEEVGGTPQATIISKSILSYNAFGKHLLSLGKFIRLIL